ncbi:hypothetical protein CAEBREN_19880 [Caenorhabditis brenneri]|uniref:GATA-type domain-containing protein n=1 Tax=Caenorhabditis brenneri TaxID=135651 RepID=G0MJ06_CAEBE|nr:hypothetical protein CAEBREN_19880 [Caenorhabditis brenneri]
MWSAAKIKTDCCSSCDTVKMENARLKEEAEMLKDVMWQLNTKLVALEQWKSTMEFQMSQPAKMKTSKIVKPKVEATMPPPCDNEQKSLKCSNCRTDRTTLWRKRLNTGEILCNPCGLYERLHRTPRPFAMIAASFNKYRVGGLPPTVPTCKTQVNDNIVLMTPLSDSIVASVQQLQVWIEQQHSSANTTRSEKETPVTATVTKITEADRLAAVIQKLQNLFEPNGQA